MDLLVCLKRTPDMSARIRIAAGGRGIDPQGVEWIINPYDAIAVEAALKIKEQRGGSVTVLSLEPSGDRQALHKALAMGADRAILLTGGAPFDAWTTARSIAGAIRGRKFDILFFGKVAVDEGDHQVPSMVAQLLGLPRATGITSPEIGEQTLRCRRPVEGGEEVIELPLPCVVSLHKGLGDPRFPQLRGILEAKKKPFEEIKLGPADPALEFVRLEPPPPRPPPRIVANVNGKPAAEIRQACVELIRLLREEAKVL